MIISMYRTTITQCSCKEELIHYHWPPVIDGQGEGLRFLEFIYKMLRRFR